MSVLSERHISTSHCGV